MMDPTLLLVAHIAGRGIAIPAAEVDSVVDIGAVVPVPRAHAAIRGVAALRSRVVTVIDTWIVLGLAAPRTASVRAVITRVDGHDYAILVDSVEDVTTLAVSPVPLGLSLDPIWASAARGAVERDGEPMLVVSLAALVPTISSPVNLPLTSGGAGSAERSQSRMHA